MADRSPEELLVHAGWLRALALRPVRDEDVVDDLVQDTTALPAMPLSSCRQPRSSSFIATLQVAQRRASYARRR